MALQSKLFRDDPKLDAALVSDPAHILQGAKGPHVVKIQQALVQLDGASISTDGAFGPGTAAAVGAFKKKRNILNTEGRIDNIVGKKTMAALDGEMLARENGAATTAKSLVGPFKIGDVPRPASFGPTQFSTAGMIKHDHRASGKFNQIKNQPYSIQELDPFDSDFALRLAIIAFLNASTDANSFVRGVIAAQFSNMPTAKAHALHYLKGNGATINEDANITASSSRTPLSGESSGGAFGRTGAMAERSSDLLNFRRRNFRSTTSRTHSAPSTGWSGRLTSTRMSFTSSFRMSTNGTRFMMALRENAR
jgi:hypothetical protein